MNNRCKNTGCWNKPTKGLKCNTCKSREYDKKFPIRRAYRNLKSNAKRRGKEFSLTFEQFQQFCVRTNYIAGKGKTSVSYSIDRIDNSKGYTAGNIQVLTLADNTKKLNYHWETGEFKVSKQTTTTYETAEQPF